MDENFLAQKLDQKKIAGLYRELPCFDGLTDFCSNDYLGFSTTLSQDDNEKTHYPPGSTGSRLISGNSVLAEETERFIASFHRAEAALIFNCGYMANVGLFSCIASKNDIVIHDELIHASVIDGIQLSHAKRNKFKHNDVSDLARILNKYHSERTEDSQLFVSIESLYSMDGDFAPLKEIADCCENYNAHLIVDEAHATGITGNKGEGLVSDLMLENNVLARVHTFGKALGLHGAAVVGSDLLRNFLINHARSFIYTTAIPPSIYGQLQSAYTLLSGNDRQNLKRNIEYFVSSVKRQKSNAWKLNDSPIQSLMISGNEAAKAMAAYLLKQGLSVKAILSPTVKTGSERIRICLHSFNTKNEIDRLMEAINIYQA